MDFKQTAFKVCLQDENYHTVKYCDSCPDFVQLLERARKNVCFGNTLLHCTLYLIVVFPEGQYQIA